MAAIVLGVGGRWLWVRNRNEYKDTAVLARAAADAAYLEFTTQLEATRLAVASLVSRLGPRDTAALTTEAEKTVPGALALDARFTAFASHSSNDPSATRCRAAYRELDRQYASFTRTFKRQLAQVRALQARCQHIEEMIVGWGGMNPATESILEEAAEMIAARRDEGWTMESFTAQLESLRSQLAQARTSMTGGDALTALRELTPVRHEATILANRVRELTRQHVAMQREVETLERQRVALGWDLNRAEGGLKAVHGVYAEDTYHSHIRDLDSARFLHGQLEGMIIAARSCIDPKADAWDEAEASLTRITEVIEEISGITGTLIVLRASLDDHLNNLETGVSYLRGRIVEVILKTRDRYGNQSHIRNALRRIDSEAVILRRALDNPLPEPDRLDTRLNELEDMLHRLDSASARIDEGMEDDDDGDGLFTTIIVGAALAIGIDLGT
ncbi:MAG TPA: hypothetical protein VJM32_05065 [Candidatus Saccharimonadales bacterium]|nr:hypothetical protein [Candidatus Saccharimonadales bacterium]